MVLWYYFALVTRGSELRKFLLMLAAAVSLFGVQIDWVHSYAEAQALAKKENKNILVLISTEKCRWCRKLESTTLKDAAVVERINSAYVAVHVTRDKDAYPAELKAKMVPMSYFLQPDGTVIHSMPGFWESMDYLSILRDVDYKLKKQ